MDLKVPSNVAPAAVSRLKSSPFSALHNLEVSADETTIILTGKVGSYYYKQLAQEAIGAIAGQREIVNNIQVTKHRRLENRLRHVHRV